MQTAVKAAVRPAALVTGGAVRLGRALALALAADGYDIALHYGRSAAAAEQTAAEIRANGVECRLFAHDLADTAGLAGLMTAVRAAFPRLNLLINSASAYGQAPIGLTTAELFDQQFAVNLRAPFFLTQAFAQQVGAGQVINILDNKIGFNQFQYAAYLLSKKALAEFTRMAALEFAPALRINGIAPGVVLPAGTRSAAYVAWRIEGIPLRRQGDVEDITAALRYLIGASFVSGQILTVDGGEAGAQIGRNAADYDPGQV
jgi:pteridine reductase